MKDKRDNIDELFNSKLNDRSFPVPEAFLDDLNKRLDENSGGKKRRFGFWWLAFALIPVVGTIIIFFSSEGSGASIEHEQRKMAFTENGKANAIGSQKSSDTSDNKKIDGQNSSNGSEGSVTQKSNFSGDSDALKKNEIRAKKVTGSTWAKKTNNTNKTKKKQTYNDKHYSSQSGKAGDGVTGVTGENKPSSPTMNIVDPLVDISTEGTEKKGGEEAMVEPLKDTLKAEEKLSEELIVISVDRVPVDSSRNDINIKPVKRNYWEVQAYGGLNYTLSQTKSANSALLNNMESPILRTQFGIEAYFNKNRSSFGSGLYFHQTGERTRYEVTNTQWVDSVFIASYEVDSVWNNQTQSFDVIQVPVYDSVSVQQTSNFGYDQGNYYSWITVPLHLRYRFAFGKYELLPVFGAQFHIAAASNIGLYPDQAISQFNEIRANRFYISYSLQAELRRNLNNSFVFIRPQYNSGLMPVISDALLERRYSSWGLIVGYGWKF